MANISGAVELVTSKLIVISPINHDWVQNLNAYISRLTINGFHHTIPIWADKENDLIDE